MSRMTPLSRLAAPPGQETIPEEETVAYPDTEVDDALQVVKDVEAHLPPRWHSEHYTKLALAATGTFLGALFAIIDPGLTPVATAISAGSLLFGGAEVNAHSKGPHSPFVSP